MWVHSACESIIRTLSSLHFQRMFLDAHRLYSGLEDVSWWHMVLARPCGYGGNDRAESKTCLTWGWLISWCRNSIHRIKEAVLVKRQDTKICNRRRKKRKNR